MDEVNAVSLALFDDHNVLLIQRATHPLKGFWTLPGGRIERGETPEQACIREIKEELGLEVENLTPVARFNAGGNKTYILQVFAAHYADGQPQPNREVSDWKWISPPFPEGLRTTPGLTDILAKATAALTRV